jgi:hypothetical protein
VIGSLTDPHEHRIPRWESSYRNSKMIYTVNRDLGWTVYMRCNCEQMWGFFIKENRT